MFSSSLQVTSCLNFFFELFFQISSIPWLNPSFRNSTFSSSLSHALTLLLVFQWFATTSTEFNFHTYNLAWCMIITKISSHVPPLVPSKVPRFFSVILDCFLFLLLGFSTVVTSHVLAFLFLFLALAAFLQSFLLGD